MCRAGLVVVADGLEHRVSVLGVAGLVAVVLWALSLEMSVAQAFAAVGFHVIPEV